MYDDLRKALIEAQTLVGWYALGEAIRLTETITRVVRYHQENPEEEKARDALVATATRVAGFLSRMGNNQKPETLNELQTILTTIQMET